VHPVLRPRPDTTRLRSSRILRSGPVNRIAPLLLLSACGPSSPSPLGTSSEASTSATTEASTAETTTSGNTVPPTGSSEAGDAGFIENVDAGPSAFECSVVEQDCAHGEKCNVWANDGGTTWNATRCFPVPTDPDGIDEPCTVEVSGTSGVDSCAAGALCWGVSSDSLQGMCTPYCTGSNANPVCEDPWRSCNISSEVVLLLCLPSCDPLDRATCPKGSACYPQQGRFGCRSDESEARAGPFAPCEHDSACSPGSACISAEHVPGCPARPGRCCAPYCDLTSPACPMGTQCFVPEPGTAAPGYEHVGFCGAAQ